MNWRLWLIGVIATLLWAGALIAQSNPRIDYKEWESLAARVERVINYDRAPDQTMERLRGEVATWRETFMDAQEYRSLRIGTVERQLEALGATPSEQSEAPAPEETAEAAEAEADPAPSPGENSVWAHERRVELTQHLADLEEPNIRAAEAFAHADGLVRELDAVLRQRKAAVVFARGPIPLNPLNWSAPIVELDGHVTAIPIETLGLLRAADAREVFLRNLPLVSVLLLLGAFLLIRGRVWTAGLRRAARNVAPPAISFPLQALVILVEVGLPWVGLAILLYAASLSNLVGPSGDALLLALRHGGLYLIIGVAFIGRLFPAGEEDPSFVALSRPQQTRARRTGFLAVYVLALAMGAEMFLSLIEVTDNTQAFWLFPFFVVLGFLVYRFSQMFLLAQPQAAEEEEEEASFALRLLDILARIGMVTGILAPAAAALGYSGVAAATIMPVCFSVFVLGLAAFFGNWLTELYTAMKRRPPDHSDLAPTYIGIAVYGALLPVLALIWGARVADLTEIWAGFREGFSMGGVKIAPADIVTFLAIFAVLYGTTRLLQAALRVSILPKTRFDIGARTAIVAGVGYIGIFLAAVIAIRSTGMNLSSLAIVAGALSVGIGFGLQTIVSNFVSGIILLIERPISKGDWIDVNGQQGYVRDISVRATRIETFDRTDLIVPNSDLISGTVTNWTHGNMVGRIILQVGVAYGSDPAKVERILREVAEAHPLVLLSPPPGILFMAFGADALEFEIRAILRDVNFSLSARSELNHEIARRLAEEGIEIPFAQRDIWLRNAEVLRDLADPAKPVHEAAKTPFESRPAQVYRDEADVDGTGDGSAGDADGGDGR
ncbi:MAG: DUF3772 domain-containing protein [Mangrovicoccus sp.]|nr:DUF3772 domain-containing protein [Mangrovicoccus sp.]